MATSVDTGVTSALALVSNRAQHVWTMSNGDLAVVYFNGSAWGYRTKRSGTWGSFTSMATLPATGAHMSGAGCRNGDTLFFGSGSDSVNYRVAKMVYTTSTGVFTVTYSAATGDSGCVMSAYYDTTNSKVHVQVRLADVGSYMSGFTASTMANSTTAKALTGAPVDSGGNQTNITYSSVGDGTATFYVVMCDTNNSTAVKVTKLVATTNNYTQTAETSVTALAARCNGLTAVYDGTNIVIAANENNAKLRVMTRTAANTYSAWSDIEAAALTGPPGAFAESSGSDVALVWARTAGQANGEIYYATRVSGTWGAATSLAGGAATGWQTPSVALSDLNGTAAIARVLYLTGTASPFTLVEDSITVGGGGTTPADLGTGISSASAGSTGTVNAASIVSGASAAFAAGTGTPLAKPVVSGASNAAGSGAGSLNAAPVISGASAAAGFSNGMPVAAPLMSGASAAAAGTTGTPDAAPVMSGSGAAVAATSGTVTVAGAAAVSGTSAAAASTGGTMVAAPVVLGASLAIAAVAGTPDAPSVVVGASVAVAAGSGTLKSAPAVTGLSVAVAGGSGQFGAHPALAGSSGVVGVTSGQPSVPGAAPLSGTSAAAAATVGAVTFAARLSSTSPAGGTTLGQVTVTAVLAGVTAAQALSSGQPLAPAVMAGASSVLAVAAGILQAVAVLAGRSDVAVLTSGTLTAGTGVRNQMLAVINTGSARTPGTGIADRGRAGSAAGPTRGSAGRAGVTLG